MDSPTTYTSAALPLEHTHCHVPRSRRCAMDRHVSLLHCSTPHQFDVSNIIETMGARQGIEAATRKAGMRKGPIPASSGWRIAAIDQGTRRPVRAQHPRLSGQKGLGVTCRRREFHVIGSPACLRANLGLHERLQLPRRARDQPAANPVPPPARTIVDVVAGVDAPQCVEQALDGSNPFPAPTSIRQ
jgi:hypothetical protein